MLCYFHNVLINVTFLWNFGGELCIPGTFSLRFLTNTLFCQSSHSSLSIQNEHATFGETKNLLFFNNNQP